MRVNVTTASTKMVSVAGIKRSTLASIHMDTHTVAADVVKKRAAIKKAVAEDAAAITKESILFLCGRLSLYEGRQKIVETNSNQTFGDVCACISTAAFDFWGQNQRVRCAFKSFQ